jgi:hypothetical protein
MGNGLAHGVIQPDWQPVIEPRILWVNTLLLGVGSGLMQARGAVNRGDAAGTNRAWWLGGLFAVAFLVARCSRGGSCRRPGSTRLAILRTRRSYLLTSARRAPARRARRVDAHEAAHGPER